MFSIGGIRSVKAWDKALSTNPTQLGINAANTARQCNVGMEIDYEKNTNPNSLACSSSLPHIAPSCHSIRRATTFQPG